MIPFFILLIQLWSHHLVLILKMNKLAGVKLRDLLPTFGRISRDLRNGEIEMEKWWCCLHKNPNRMGFWRASKWALGEWQAQKPQAPSHIPCPAISLPSGMFVHIPNFLYNKLFTWVALATAQASSVNCSGKLQQGVGCGSGGTSDLEPTYQSTGDHLNLGFEVRDEGQSFGTWALTLIWHNPLGR